jgi:hypothetical protein
MLYIIVGVITYILWSYKNEKFGKPNGCFIFILVLIGATGIAALITVIEKACSTDEHHTLTAQHATPSEAQIEKHKNKMKRQRLHDNSGDTLPPITFMLSAEANESGMVSIVLETNLPDDTVVMVTLANPSSEYAAQDTLAVSGGKCRTGFFSNGESALSAGTYQVTVTVPVAQVQPENVQAVIGTQGENLTGPYVKMGVDSKIVQFSQDIQIGTTQR